jgi:ubiquinone/menaquinone biosynthesis C-methylase UbiE
MKRGVRVKDEDIRKAVKKGYAEMARKKDSCCASATDCCGPQASRVSKTVGYTEEELKSIPGDADMGLGCGNPVALSSIIEGDTVLDLGSGGGIDCFLAAQEVGHKGKVIGIDMTPEMIEKARENAKKSGYDNVEFRLGEIEDLPVDDNSVDIIISNCVINLSPNKEGVFKEAFRVLKPGGRMVVSDIVLLKELPESVRTNLGAYIGCLSGAILKNQYIDLIKRAGFRDVSIQNESSSSTDWMPNDPTVNAMMRSFEISREEAEDVICSILSIVVEGTKPV